MIRLLKTVPILFPVVLFGQISVTYEDIVGAQAIVGIDSNITQKRIHFEKGSGYLESHIEIYDSTPFPIVKVAFGGETKFTTDGYITELKDDSTEFKIKVVRPPCCCLTIKEINVYSYNKSTGKNLTEVYQIHQDLLVPIRDVVFSFKDTHFDKDSLSLYPLPYISKKETTDECTGEKVIGNSIGQYRTASKCYKLYEGDQWALCAVQVETNELDKKHWVLGWVNFTP